MREQFPRSLLTLLAYCIGKEHLVAEDTGINGETPVEDKPGATDELEGGGTDAENVVIQLSEYAFFAKGGS